MDIYIIVFPISALTLSVIYFIPANIYRLFTFRSDDDEQWIQKVNKWSFFKQKRNISFGGNDVKQSIILWVLFQKDYIISEAAFDEMRESKKRSFTNLYIY